MKRTLLASVALACALACGAQPSSAALRYSLEYQGEMGFHPGLRLSAQLPLSLGVGFSLTPGLEFGGYLHPSNLRALQASALAGLSWRGASGFHMELGAGLGAQVGFSDGSRWALRPDGSVGPVADPGQASLVFQTDLRAGGRFAGAEGKNWDWQIGPRCQWEYPVNGLAVPRILLLCGATYRTEGEI
jgi:hypothetical protein